MPNPMRMRWPTITLSGDAQGIVHLDSVLPEVIAMGTEAWLEFRRGVFPLGGPHAVVNIAGNPGRNSTLRITTPECEFEYEVYAAKQDEAGWFFLLKRTYVSTAYAAWVNSR